MQFTLPGIPLIYTGDEIGAAFEPYDEGPPLRWHDSAGHTPYYTRLARLRRSTPALWSPRLELVGNDQADKVLSYVRPGVIDDDAVLVALNFSEQPVSVNLAHDDDSAAPVLSGKATNLLTGTAVTLDPMQPRLQLPPYGVMVLQRAE
jgi:glycosidase